jgi:hypothetical protein
VFVFKDLTYTTFPLFSALQDIRLIIRHIFIRVVFDVIFDSLFYDALPVTPQYSVDDRVKRERWWRDEDKYQCLKYFTSHRRNWAVAIILRFICLLNLKLFIYLFVVWRRFYRYLDYSVEWEVWKWVMIWKGHGRKLSWPNFDVLSQDLSGGNENYARRAFWGIGLNCLDAETASSNPAYGMAIYPRQFIIITCLSPYYRRC